jgi:hypothetical protein
MTYRAATFAAVICLSPAAAFAQAPTSDLPRLSTSISGQSSKIVLDQADQTGQAPKPTPPAKSAQPEADKQSHWGISASFTPQWKMWSKISNAIADSGQTWTVEGKQFTVGVVHGRSQGGDFGIDYVSQSVKNGSNVQSTEVQCTGQNNAPPCFTLQSSDVTDNVKMSGIKAHFFIPFVTIKQRIQAGINIGVGVAQLSGNVLETSQDLTFVPNTPPTQGGTFKVTTTVATRPVKDVFELPIIPLFDLDVAVAFIITPAIKIRYQGGVGIPGTKKFQIMGTYLFGSH